MNVKISNEQRFSGREIEQRCPASDGSWNPSGAEWACVHFNLLDRESYVPRQNVHADAPEGGEITQTWCLRHEVEEILGRADLVTSSRA